MGNDNLRFAWSRHNSVDSTIDALRDLSARLAILNAAAMVQTTVIRCWHLARIKPLLRHTFSATVAYLAQIRISMNRSFQTFANYVSSLRGAQEIRAEYLNQTVFDNGTEPVRDSICVTIALLRKVSVVPSTDFLLYVVKRLGVGNDKYVLHAHFLRRLNTQAIPRLYSKRGRILQPAISPHTST